jgi:hypothetical protein
MTASKLFQTCIVRFDTGKTAVLEKILDLLDYKSLAKVHQVSKSWNQAASGCHLWRSQLQYQVNTKFFVAAFVHILIIDIIYTGHIRCHLEGNL